MKLQLVTHSPYTFLPSGILIVEPHKGLLAARTMLLAAADYYVGVSGSTGTEVPEGRSEGYEVAVAILSESLGYTILTSTARAVRERWRYARILILGRGKSAIEDYLYDARIDHKARPEDLLAALMMLSEDPWNQRVRPAKLLTEGKYRLPNGGINYIAESDPTKRHASAIDMVYLRDMPAGEKRFKLAS
jgi:hypothetical protein